MVSLWFLACFFALVLTVRAEIVDNDEENWQIFRKLLSDPRNFNGTVASQLARNFEDPRILAVPIGGKSVVHQLLNLYWTTSDREIKASLVDTLLTCINLGAPVDRGTEGEPGALLKSLLIREMSVALAIASASSDVIKNVDGSVLKELYSIPCNPTPITKLLLHAQSISAHARSSSSRVDENTKEKDLSDLRELLLGARLDGQSPVVSTMHLGNYSTTFNTVLARLAAQPPSLVGADISLSEVMGSLGEVAAVVQKKLLDSKYWDPIDVAQALSYELDSDRNSLHFLAMSGSAVMLADLAAYFQGKCEAATEPLGAVPSMSALACKMLQSALTRQDMRQKTPADYVMLRYGMSPTLTAIRQLMAAAGLPVDALNDDLQFNSAINVAQRAASAARKRRPAQDAGQLSRDGGWSQQTIDTDTVGDLQRCDVEERWDGLPSNQEFFVKYVSTGTPVIFRGAAFNTQIRNAFEKKNFVEKYGNFRAPSSTIPYAGSFGVPARATTLADIADFLGENISASETAPSVDGLASVVETSRIDSAPRYVFTVSSQQWRPLLLEDAPVPSCLNIRVHWGRAISEEDGSVAMQFYLGPAGSGAPVHFHGHAANTLAYGEKKWYLFPPSAAFYSKTPALDFVRHDPRAQEAMQCTQRAGDIFYVPSLWGHATLNVKQSVGVAHEFSVEPFCME